VSGFAVVEENYVPGASAAIWLLLCHSLQRSEILWKARTKLIVIPVFRPETSSTVKNGFSHEHRTLFRTPAHFKAKAVFLLAPNPPL
jgi:hypothetical protein